MADGIADLIELKLRELCELQARLIAGAAPGTGLLESTIGSLESTIGSLESTIGPLESTTGPLESATALTSESVRRLETRSQYIAAMHRLRGGLSRLAAAIGRDGAAADAAYRAEINGALSRISAAPPIMPVPRPRERVRAREYVPAPQPIAICQSLSLDAVPVPSHLTVPAQICAAIRSPGLYFVPQWGHFAFRVGDCVFHGGIGRVYSGRSEVEKVRACRRAACTRNRCRYYHDPARYPGSTDVRNFIEPKGNSRLVGIGRRISAETIETDLMTVSPVIVQQLADFAAHSVLCALASARPLCGLATGPNNAQ